MKPLALAPLVLLAACSATPPGGDDSAADADAIDERMTPADYADASPDATLLTGPDVVVDAGQDVMWCISGTYTGEDAGIVTLATYQGAYGHHLQLYGTSLSTLDLPDGKLWDCTSSNDMPMDDLEPLAFTTKSNNSDLGVEIPDGYAVKIDANQRWVLQSHYLNVGDEPIRVQDVEAMETIDPDTVGTWAAPLYINHSVWELAPGVATHTDFDLVLQQQLNVLVLVGHMHEWGTGFSTGVVEGDTVTNLYNVPTWQAAYRDAPPINSYAPGELTLAEGTTLRQSCDWFNDTDETIEFPHEMCVTVGLVYPFTTPIGYSD